MTAPLNAGLALERSARHRSSPAQGDKALNPTHPLVRLQNQAGNAAVARLVQRLQDGAVQRNGDEMDEEEVTQAKHDPSIQRAGAMPDEEMVMGAHDEGHGDASVGLEGGSLPAEAADRIDSMRGTGSAVGEHLRAAAEPALGVDLAPVRVHQDSASDALARGMTAKAFTSGADIFLRGDVSPGDSRLMSHELTHVAQQAEGDISPAGQRMTVGAADDPLEHEADRVAEVIASGSGANREIDDR